MTRSQKILVGIFMVCAVPVLIAAGLHWFSRPTRLSNYGDLIEPQMIASSESFRNINGDAFKMSSLKGKWVLIQIMPSQCDEVCQKTQFYLRQVRKTKGKDADRIERVAFVVDEGPLDTMLLRQFSDVHFVRASRSELQSWLPLIEGAADHRGQEEQIGELTDHVFVVDPLGHVMMRFPNNASLEFERLRKDISRLLWASNIG